MFIEHRYLSNIRLRPESNIIPLLILLQTFDASGIIQIIQKSTTCNFAKKRDVTDHEFESAIIAEIYKQAKTLSLPVSFYHLRTVDGLEIDLIIENGYIAIEIKQAQNITHSDAHHLKHLQEILDKPLLQSFLLSNDNKITEMPGNILSMPAAMFLS